MTIQNGIDPHPPPENQAPETDLREAVATLWRGKWTITAFALFAALAAALLTARIPASFEAEAKVRLDTRVERVADIEDVVGALSIDNAVTASEIAVMRSDDVLAEVAARLSLSTHPTFSREQAGVKERLLRRIRPLHPMIAEWAPAPEARSPATVARHRLKQSLIISQVGRSYVIRIAARTSDPALSSAIANEVADAYVDRQVGAKRAATDRAASWLAERIAALKAEVANADAAVEAFKTEQGFGEGDGADVTGQQLAAINSELVSARAARAEAEARRDQVAVLITARGRGAAADVLSSPLILSLRQEEAQAKRRRAELATRYGPKHPQMVNAEAEIRDLSGAIGREVSKLIAGLDNDVAVALAREKTLAAEVTGLEDRSLDLSRSSIGLRQLEREADATRRIYENFLDRSKETTETAPLQQADARIITRAAPPLAPVAPRKDLITAIAGIGGGLAGLALVFLGELMVNTFRTGAEAERILRLPLLARLPRLKRAKRRKAVLKSLSRYPNSAYAEAIRGLRNALILAHIDNPPRAVMVTSAAPGEGKTTTCLALAQMSAAMGKSAVVVECDFRRPQLAYVLEPGVSQPDLLSVLEGDSPVEDALRSFNADGAWLLPLNKAAPHSADALSSQAFRAMVKDLTNRFDLVLLDTPPALAVSDAAAVGAAADACLFLTRWNATPRQAAQECIRRLTDMGAPPVGVALTLVDPKREAAYEYGGYGAKAPDYSPYYG